MHSEPGCGGEHAIPYPEMKAMTRILTLFLTIILFGCAACWAADNAVVGKWDVVATDEAGSPSNWTLVVKEDGGKLSGTLSGDPGEFPIVDAKVDGKAFSFKVVVNEADYVVEGTVDGNKFEGKYKGPEASGTVKGSRQS
jgi:hypothetical protein